MAIDYIRVRDSDGVEHLLDRQDQPQSCALASIGMVWRQIRHLKTNNIGRKLPDYETDELNLRLFSGLFAGSLLDSQLQGQGRGVHPKSETR